MKGKARAVKPTQKVDRVAEAPTAVGIVKSFAVAAVQIVALWVNVVERKPNADLQHFPHFFDLPHPPVVKN